MELLRIVSMVLVIGLHMNYASLGIPSALDVQHALTSTICRVFLQQFCLVCVNIFVLISGWYGIKPSLKGALKLLFQVFFIEAIMLVIMKSFGMEIPGRSLVKLFIVGSGYWFVPAYLILYCLSPILNSFFNNANSKEACCLVLVFFILQLVYGHLADFAHFEGGYSAISFLGLYALARYARLHPVRLFQFPAIFDIAVIIATTILSTVIALFLFAFESKFIPQATFNNPLVIIASLYWVLLFSKIPFKNRFVNWMGKSSFAIYLTHCQPLLFVILVRSMGTYYSTHKPIEYLGMTFLMIVGIVIGSILMDQVRILFWNTLNKAVKLVP